MRSRLLTDVDGSGASLPALARWFAAAQRTTLIRRPERGTYDRSVVNAILDEALICVTVTLIDGLVMARSAFHHSMNYRSVVILGVAREVEDEGEKRGAFAALVDHVLAGRSVQTREPSARELKATSVLCVPIEETSAKVRTGPPLDEEDDYALPYWAGVLPVRLEAQSPIADPRLPAGIPTPASLLDYRRAKLPG